MLIVRLAAIAGVWIICIAIWFQASKNNGYIRRKNLLLLWAAVLTCIGIGWIF